jgi:sulfotransferase
MNNGIHFISGLPRAGSTLLAGILRQNPRFHAAMTSPVGAIYLAMQSAVSRKNEAAVFIDAAQKRRLLEGVFLNYYQDISAEKIVFDTNRLWCTKMQALAEHFPNSRVICCVRHVSWIMDSIERLVRHNTLDLSGIFGFDAGGTVFTRVNALAASDGMVGFALDALRQAYFGEHPQRLMLVEYGALTGRPERTMAEIYEFIGEPLFAHDFDDVEYDARDFDLALGSPGLHQVRRKVEFVERASLLPPDLFRRFENDAFWVDPQANIRNVRVIRHTD